MTDESLGSMSYAEYLAFERESATKHEYVNGQVYPMAVGDVWQHEAAGPGERLRLDEHDLELDVDALYRSNLAP